MSRHRATRQPSRQERDVPQQLPLVAPVAKVRPRNVDPEAAATIAIQRRAKPSAMPGSGKRILVLELRRALAERRSTSSIREGKNLEAILIEILRAAAPMFADLEKLRGCPPAMRNLR